MLGQVPPGAINQYFTKQSRESAVSQEKNYKSQNALSPILSREYRRSRSTNPFMKSVAISQSKGEWTPRGREEQGALRFEIRKSARLPDLVLETRFFSNWFGSFVGRWRGSDILEKMREVGSRASGSACRSKGKWVSARDLFSGRRSVKCSVC